MPIGGGGGGVDRTFGTGSRTMMKTTAGRTPGNALGKKRENG